MENDSAVFFNTLDTYDDENPVDSHIKGYLTVNGKEIDMEPFLYTVTASTAGDCGDTTRYRTYKGYIYAKKNDIIHLYGRALNNNSLYSRKLR